MTLNSTVKVADGKSQTPGQETLPGDEIQTSSAEQLASILDDRQYKGADVKKLINDALAADGRTQKERAETAEAKAKALEAKLSGLSGEFGGLRQQLEAFTKARDDAEAEAVAEDPDALKSLRTRQENRRKADELAVREAKIAEEKAQIEADKAEVSRFKAEKEARRIANLPEFKIDADKLFALVDNGDTEKLKRAAKILKESGVVAQTTTTTTQTRPPGLTTKPASIISAGGDEDSVAKMLERAKTKAK